MARSSSSTTSWLAETTASSRPQIPFGILLTAMVGAALLLYGVLAQGSVVLPWFVPVCDVAAVLSLATTVALGSLDTQLRRTLRLVKSKPDRGSTFLLSPPLAPTTAGRSVSASVTASRSGSR